MPKTGTALPGGGVYIKNRSEALLACDAMLSCKTANMACKWHGTFLWVAFTPKVGKRKLKRQGTIFQRVGNRLIYLPNDGWWPTNMAGVIKNVDAGPDEGALY